MSFVSNTTLTINSKGTAFRNPSGVNRFKAQISDGSPWNSRYYDTVLERVCVNLYCNANVLKVETFWELVKLLHESRIRRDGGWGGGRKEGWMDCGH